MIKHKFCKCLSVGRSGRAAIHAPIWSVWWGYVQNAWSYMLSKALTHLPMVECREAEGLALRMVAQVCLKAEALQDWQESLDNEDGCSRLGDVGCDMPPPLGQHIVDGCYAVCTAL